MKNYFNSFIPSYFRILIIYFGSLLLISSLWRFIFLLSNINNIELKNIFLYINSFFIALRLDAVITSYFALPFFFIIILPYIGWQNKIVRKLLFGYAIITYIFYSFIAIIDIEFFKEFGTHLNILAFQSNAHSKELWQYIWQKYPIILSANRKSWKRRSPSSDL